MVGIAGLTAASFIERCMGHVSMMVDLWLPGRISLSCPREPRTFWLDRASCKT